MLAASCFALGCDPGVPSTSFPASAREDADAQDGAGGSGGARLGQGLADASAANVDARAWSLDGARDSGTNGDRSTGDASDSTTGSRADPTGDPAPNASGGGGSSSTSVPGNRGAGGQATGGRGNQPAATGGTTPATGGGPADVGGAAATGASHTGGASGGASAGGRGVTTGGAPGGGAGGGGAAGGKAAGGGGPSGGTAGRSPTGGATAEGGGVGRDGAGGAAGRATGDRDDAGAAGGTAGEAGGLLTRAPRPGDLRIDEVMIDPLGADLGKEWIELVNISPDALDLSHLVVADDVSERPLVAPVDRPQAATLPPGLARVLGQSADLDKNGGVTVDLVYGTQLGLNNGADRLAVCWVSCGALLLDEVRWDVGDTTPSGRALVIGASGQRCGAVTPYGPAVSGSFNAGTPGGPNDACP